MVGALALVSLVLVGCQTSEPEPPRPPPGSRASAVSPAVQDAVPPAVQDSAAVSERPSVLLVIVDTLRADRLPAYGFDWGKAPNLGRLAADSVVFERGIAASAATIPSHASMFTSRFVRQHSVGHNNGDTRLTDEATLAEYFRDAGYATAAFISNVMLNSATGLGRGYELYDENLPVQEPNRPFFFERHAPNTTRRAIRWLERQAEKPVFLTVHYQDPHGPYTPPERVLRAIPSRDRGLERRLPTNPTQSGLGGLPNYQALPGVEFPGEYEERYVAEILYMDRWLGLLLKAFDRHRPGAGHVVLFTSDHGESLGENNHWFEHGHASSPDIAHIPFVLKAPGVEPERRTEPVSHVDVLPTLLELSGVEVPDEVSGIALGPYLRNSRDLPARKLYCDLGIETGVYDESGWTRVRFPSYAAAARGDMTEIRAESYAWSPESGWSQEATKAEVSGEAEGYFSAVKAPRAVDRQLSPEEVKRLQALGYLEPDE